MAKEKAAKQEDTTLVSAAKTIGKAAGKLAALAGVEGTAPAAKPVKGKAKEAEGAPRGETKPAKFEKKTTGRLPRREKKERKKAEAAASA